MPSNVFKISKFKCWERSSLEDVFPAQAHVQEPSFFLSTHVPFDNISVVKEETSLREGSERSLIDNISNPSTEFELVFIKGTQGSGKSHLIRWLYYEWIRHFKDDEAIFIPRRDATLQGTLQKLVERLGENFDDLAQQLGKAASNLNERGLANRLYDNLTQSLDPEGLIDSYEGSEHVEQSGIVDVLREAGPRRNLLGKDKIFSRIIKKIISSDNQGEDFDYNIEEFSEDDIITLFNDCKEGLPRHLVKTFQGYINDDGKLNKLRATINERLRIAQQDVIGLQPRDLLNIILQLRERLFPKRLVLLIEDVSCFQGVDYQLMEAIIDPGEKERKLSTLISVVGITSQYYAEQISPKANIVGRTTYVIDLSTDDADSVGVGSVLFEDEANVANFVATYLNASRLDPQEVDKWYRDAQEGANEIESACDKCKHQEICHSTFGHVDGRGLYPLNENYVRTINSSVISKAEDIEIQLTTPRTIIAYLRFFLNEASHDGKNLLDPKLINRHLMRSKLTPLGVQDEQTIDQIGGSDKDKLKTLSILFGDSTARYTINQQGEHQFFGLPKSIFDVLELKIAEVEITPTEATPPTPSTDETNKESATPDGESDEESDGSSNEDARSKKVDPVSRPRREFFEKIDRWLEGAPLEEDESIRKSLRILLSNHIPWQLHQIPKPLAQYHFTDLSIEIEGQRTRSVPGRVLVRIKRNSQNALALKALWELSKNQKANDVYSNQIVLYRLARMVSPKIIQKLRAIQNGVEEGEHALVSRATEILYLTSFLRGKIRPKYEHGTKITACIGQPVDAEDEELFFGDWGGTMRLLRQHNKALQQFVLNWFDRGQERADRNFFDPSVFLGNIKNFEKTFDLGDFQKDLKQKNYNLVNQVIKENVVSELRKLEDNYYDSLRTMAEEVSDCVAILSTEKISDFAILEFFNSIENLCEKLGGNPPRQLLECIRTWGTRSLEAKTVLKDRKTWTAKNVTEIADRLADCIESNNEAERLDVISHMPVSDIKRIVSLIDAGSDLCDTVEDYYEIDEDDELGDEVAKAQKKIEEEAVKLVKNIDNFSSLVK